MKAGGMMADRKERTHEKILAASARLLRKDGVKATSVAKVMDEAGLTVGGFYAHFDSKEDLVAETFRYALEESGMSILGTLPPGLHGADKLRAFLKGYLSPQHRDRDRSGQGCPVAALSGEIGKGSASLHKVFTSELEKLAEERAGIFSDGRFKPGGREMLAIMSTYVGGLTLARATRGSGMSDLILESCRSQLEVVIQKMESQHS
jgi:TetR/AcrR family transcriptional repressor of nem operon